MFGVILSECNLHCDFCTIPFEKRTLLKNNKPPTSTRVEELNNGTL
jgi:MoaA/NifB/PqqE/SkfB family radical SAM enzyme